MAYLISTRCHSISQRPLILIFKRGRIVIGQLNGASMRAMELELIVISHIQWLTTIKMVVDHCTCAQHTHTGQREEKRIVSCMRGDLKEIKAYMGELATKTSLLI